MLQLMECKSIQHFLRFFSFKPSGFDSCPKHGTFARDWNSVRSLDDLWRYCALLAFEMSCKCVEYLSIYYTCIVLIILCIWPMTNIFDIIHILCTSCMYIICTLLYNIYAHTQHILSNIAQVYILYLKYNISMLYTHFTRVLEVLEVLP